MTERDRLSSSFSSRSATLLRWGMLAMLAVLLGCDNPTSTPLRLGTNVWPGYEPLYLARDLGYFDDQPIILVEYPSASEVMRAFRNESLEVGALTLDEALLLREKNIPVKIFLVTDISWGADVILGQPGLDSIDQLRGRTVGVETTAVGALMLSRALSRHGLEIGDVTIADLQISEHESAFIEGRVDAVVTFDPVRTRLLENAAAVELFSSRDIPNEIVDVLVIHEAALDRDPRLVAALTEGWFRALDFLETSPEIAASLMAERLGLSPAEVLSSYDGLVLPDRVQNRRLLHAEDGALYPVTHELQATLLEWQLLARPVEPRGLLTHRFVD